MAPSHYLNQCSIIVIWTRTNTFQLNCNRNSNIFIQENAFQNVAWKMLAILSRPQCVKCMLSLPVKKLGTLSHPHVSFLCRKVGFHCKTKATWWRHQMQTFSALLAICVRNSPVTGEFPAQRPVMRSFDIFFDLRLNKRSSKQWWGWWFETPSCSLWHHCNEGKIQSAFYSSAPGMCGSNPKGIIFKLIIQNSSGGQFDVKLL